MLRLINFFLTLLLLLSFKVVTEGPEDWGCWQRWWQSERIVSIRQWIGEEAEHDSVKLLEAEVLNMVMEKFGEEDGNKGENINLNFNMRIFPIELLNKLK